MTSTTFLLNSSIDPAEFFGINNANVKALSNLFPNLTISARGNSLRVSGGEEKIADFGEVFHRLEAFFLEFKQLSDENVVEIVRGGCPIVGKQENLILYGEGGRQIIAKTSSQQKMVEAFEKNDLVFAIGAAGSGKTYCAISLAVRALKNREVRRIILSRPAIEAGEKLGFLPGDLKEKIDPYLQPLYDALGDMIPARRLQEFIEKGVVQIAPLAFMRGRTLSDAIIILDEAQNATPAQIKMFLTRLGKNSKMILTGDLTQIDLPASTKSGLYDAIHRLSSVEGIASISFSETDILRHSLVKKIFLAYQD